MGRGSLLILPCYSGCDCERIQRLNKGSSMFSHVYKRVNEQGYFCQNIL
jgi:hypothetical protein